MYTYKSPPGAVLHHHDPAAVVPAGQLGTALAAVVVHVLEGAHQVRDTSETAAEAENGRPATLEFVSFLRDWIWGMVGVIAGIAPANTAPPGDCTHWVVPPDTASVLVISRRPQHGQSTGAGADCSACKGVAVA